MILPCPHCRNRFQLAPALLRQGPVKLQCPACGGTFVVRPPEREPERVADQAADCDTLSREAGPSGGGVPGEAPVIPEYPFWDDPEYGPEIPGRTRERFMRHLTRRWVLSGVLVVAVVLVLVVAWIRPGPADRERDASGPGARIPPATGVSEQEPDHRVSVGTGSFRRLPTLDPGGPAVPLDRAAQPFSGSDPDATCKKLLDLQREQEGTGTDSCPVYPPWIVYLATQPAPGAPTACNGDAPYRLAVRGIRERNLCAWGNAYLAAYYAYKKIADRSLLFIQEAIRQAPQDPWVRLAEVLYYQRALQDPETAREILHELIQTPPVSDLSRYLLACLYIRKGDFGRAGEIFEPLVQSFPDRPEFERIRASLAFAQSAPHGSPARAGSMLELGLIFSALKEYTMAADLYQEVLRKVPDLMSTEEKRIAYLEMGRIHELQGDKLKASASYRNALRVDPRSVEALQRLRTLTGEPAPSN